MNSFGGFKSSPAKLKTNYEKGFKNMSDKQLKNVVKRHEARGTSKETAFSSDKEAIISMDSLSTAKKELNRRKLDKMDPSGRIRKSRLLPKKSSPTQKNQKLIDKAAKMGKKGTDMLKKMFDIPATRVFNKIKRADELYKGVNLGKRPKSIKYPKVAAGVKGAKSKTDKEIEAARATLNKKKK